MMTNSQPIKSTNKTENRKIDKNQDKHLKFLQRIITLAFIVQAALIGVSGNLDILSGKPLLDVIQAMITQGIELIIKAQGLQKRLKKSESEATASLFRPSIRLLW